jgi:hypothetical protein
MKFIPLLCTLLLVLFSQQILAQSTTTTTTTAPQDDSGSGSGSGSGPPPYYGPYLKDPAGMFLIVIFISVVIGLFTTLIFHNLIQPRYAFITAPSDNQLLGVRSSVSGKNYQQQQNNISHHQIDSSATGVSYGEALETGYGSRLSEPGM